MVTVQETEIDGVLCFWVDTGRPTSSARLIFRQGTADEPLHESGWLHLIQHLALRDRDSASLRVEGSVSTLLTDFEIEGGPDQVVAQLASLSTWLSEPDFSLLAHDRGLVKSAAEQRDGSLERAMTRRYGAVGPGAAGFAEAGVLRATPELLVERSRRVFNRANGILVLGGEPPAGLTLRLPAGEYLPPAEAHTLDTPLPSAYPESAGMVISGAVALTPEARLLPELLDRGIFEELRGRAGGAYAPWSVYELVDDRHAIVACGSKLIPELLPHVVDVSLELTRRIAAEGVPDSWLEDAVGARLRVLESPAAAMAVAVQAAHAALSASVPQTHEELVAELYATDPARVRAAAIQFGESLLLGIPEAAALDDQLPMPADPELEPDRSVARHRHVNWPADLAGFSAGGGGIQRVDGHTARLLPADHVVGLFAWRDGTRHVVGRDGWTLRMDPRQWHKGQELTKQLDRAVPEHLHLSMPDRIDTFRRMTFVQRWAAAGARFAGTTPGLLVALTLDLLLAVVVLASGHPVPGVLLLLVAAGAAVPLVLRYRSRVPLEPETDPEAHPTEPAVPASERV
jgi:hypothetical protein